MLCDRRRLLLRRGHGTSSTGSKHYQLARLHDISQHHLLLLPHCAFDLLLSILCPCQVLFCEISKVWRKFSCRLHTPLITTILLALFIFNIPTSCFLFANTPSSLEKSEEARNLTEAVLGPMDYGLIFTGGSLVGNCSKRYLRSATSHRWPFSPLLPSR